MDSENNSVDRRIENRIATFESKLSAACADEPDRINLLYLVPFWPRSCCRKYLLPDCKCLASRSISQNKAQVEGGLAKRKYPNWDPRSEYYQSIMGDVTYEALAEEDRE